VPGLDHSPEQVEPGEPGAEGHERTRRECQQRALQVIDRAEIEGEGAAEPGQGRQQGELEGSLCAQPEPECADQARAAAREPRQPGDALSRAEQGRPAQRHGCFGARASPQARSEPERAQDQTESERAPLPARQGGLQQQAEPEHGQAGEGDEDGVSAGGARVRKPPCTQAVEQTDRDGRDALVEEEQTREQRAGAQAGVERQPFGVVGAGRAPHVEQRLGQRHVGVARQRKKFGQPLQQPEADRFFEP
jgi:hypothetical protein